MSPVELGEVLAMFARELDGIDARLEWGGRAPTDERMLCCPIASGFRLVVVLEAPPADRVAAIARLERLRDAFLAGEPVAMPELPPLRAASAEPGPDGAVRRPGNARLAETLAQIAERAHAERAWVIDRDSPVLWGGSHPTVLATVEDAQEIAARTDPDRHPLLAPLAVAVRASELRSIRALATVRALDAWPHRSAVEPLGSGDAVAYFRTFANIYALVLVFAGGYSELHAEAAVMRGLPVVERLVLSLPPEGPIRERRRR